MKTNTASIQKRLTTVEEILDTSPDMWPGELAGFRRERTRLRNEIINKKRDEAGRHNKVRKIKGSRS